MLIIPCGVLADSPDLENIDIINGNEKYEIPLRTEQFKNEDVLSTGTKPTDNGCPPDAPLRGRRLRSKGTPKYNCYTCSRLSATRDSDCELRCPNRITWKGDGCALKECPPNAPMRDVYGSCWSCKVLEHLAVQLENPEDCEKMCPDGVVWHSDSKYFNNACVLKNCPEGSIRGSDGRCLLCESYTGVGSNFPLNAEECEKCGLIGWECPTCIPKLQCVPKKCPGDLRDEEGRCECGRSSFSVDDPQKCSLCDLEDYVAIQHERGWMCEKNVQVIRFH